MSLRRLEATPRAPFCTPVATWLLQALPPSLRFPPEEQLWARILSPYPGSTPLPQQPTQDQARSMHPPPSRPSQQIYQTQVLTLLQYRATTWPRLRYTLDRVQLARL